MTTARVQFAAAAIAFGFILSGVSNADSVAIGSSRDNTLYEDPEGDLSNGAGSGMFAGRNASASNNRRRALVLFDIAGSIPAGATITGATLTLSNSAANAGASTVSLHRTLQDWGEGTSAAGMGGGGGAPATAGDATWLFREFPGTVWSSPGGSFAPMASAAADVAGPGAYSWTGAGLIADIQAFLDSPAQNFGWTLIGDESMASTTKRFATREETDVGPRPILMIEFTPVPSPGGAAALALAAAAAAARRRR